MGGAALGKMLGFVRELEMARLLGAGTVADSYRGAMTTTLLPLLPLLSDLVPAVLIPLHRKWQKEGRAPQLQAALCTAFLAIGILVAVLVHVFAAAWTNLLLHGFGPEAQAITARFTKVMALALPACALGAALGATELSLGRPRITVMRSTVQNLGVMAGIGVMAATGQPLAIAWGFAIAQNFVALYGGVLLMRREEIAPRRVRPRLVYEAAAAFLLRMRPLLAIPAAEQAHYVVERLLASRVGQGTVASLDYARTLTESAQFLVSQPLGYAVLVRDADAIDPGRARAEAIIAPMLAVTIPASVFLAIFAPDIVRVVLARGAFGDEAVALTTGAMRGIAAGLWAATVGWVLLSMANAQGRTLAVGVVMVLGFMANVLANFVLVPSFGPLGLGLGEAVRGLMVLAGAGVVLGCVDILLRRLALAVPAALLLTLAGFAVVDGLSMPLARLTAAMPVFALGTAGWLGLIMPGAWRMAWRRLRRQTAATSESP